MGHAAKVRERLPLLLSMVALLVLAIVVARGGSGVPHGAGWAPRPAAAPSYVTTPVVAAGPPGPLRTVLGIYYGVFFVLVLVGLLAGLALALALVARIRFRRRSRAVLAEEVEAAEGAAGGLAMLRGARSALASFRQRPGGPPGDVVQQAWLSLENAAEAEGFGRRPEQTSTEFTTFLLAEHAVDEAALAELRGRYQRARFGRAGTVTEADAVAAIGALERIAEDLAR